MSVLTSQKTYLGLAAFHAADAVACAAQVAPIKEILDRLDVPEGVRPVVPAIKAAAGMGAYAAAKAGVHRLTESLAEEMKGKVRVNAILPSILDTPANRADMPKADWTAWVSPAEAAAAILFLASDKASAITGALLPVTGRM